MARKRSRKALAKQRTQRQKARQKKRTQRQKTRQRQRTKRQTQRQQRRTERQAQRQKTKRARIKGKTDRKVAQYEAGFAPGAGVAQVIETVGEVAPGVIGAGVGLASALGPGGEGEFGALDMFTGAMGGGGAAPAMEEAAFAMDTQQTDQDEERPTLTDQPWFLPAVAIGVLGTAYMLFGRNMGTKKKKKKKR